MRGIRAHSMSGWSEAGSISSATNTEERREDLRAVTWLWCVETGCPTPNRVVAQRIICVQRLRSISFFAGTDN